MAREFGTKSKEPKKSKIVGSAKGDIKTSDELRDVPDQISNLVTELIKSVEDAKEFHADEFDLAIRRYQ